MTRTFSTRLAATILIAGSLGACAQGAGEFQQKTALGPPRSLMATSNTAPNAQLTASSQELPLETASGVSDVTVLDHPAGRTFDFIAEEVVRAARSSRLDRDRHRAIREVLARHLDDWGATRRVLGRQWEHAERWDRDADVRAVGLALSDDLANRLVDPDLGAIRDLTLVRVVERSPNTAMVMTVASFRDRDVPVTWVMRSVASGFRITDMIFDGREQTLVVRRNLSDERYADDVGLRTSPQLLSFN